MVEEIKARELDLPCPFCKKGKLKPTGFTGWQENPETREIDGSREYACDECERKIKTLITVLVREKK